MDAIVELMKTQLADPSAVAISLSPKTGTFFLVIIDYAKDSTFLPCQDFESAHRAYKAIIVASQSL